EIAHGWGGRAALSPINEAGQCAVERQTSVGPDCKGPRAVAARDPHRGAERGSVRADGRGQATAARRVGPEMAPRPPMRGNRLLVVQTEPAPVWRARGLGVQSDDLQVDAGAEAQEMVVRAHLRMLTPDGGLDAQHVAQPSDALRKIWRNHC